MNRNTTPDATRRRFLGAAAGSLAAPLVVPAGALGRGTTAPGNRVTLGIIGSGNRAIFEARHWVPIESCEVVAVCDVQETRRTEAKATFEKLYSERKAGGSYKGIRMYNDFRELLRQPDIDAVYIVTPDHWHVPILIAALKAGKAVHQEKPLGVSIEQDLAALKALKKYKRPFFYGPEERSTPHARKATELVLNGRIGTIKEIYVVAPPSKAGGTATPEPVPKGFDWDMWLGPAPEVLFSRARCTGEGIFHITDYCLGFIANWGAHPVDQLQWWADNSSMGIPVTYEGSGTMAKDGLYDCATAWDLRLTFANGLVVNYMDGPTFSRKENLPPMPVGPVGRRIGNGVVYVGTEGVVVNTYGSFRTEPASLAESVIGPNEIHLPQSPLHPEMVTGKKDIWEFPAAMHQLAWIESLTSGKPGVHSIDTAVNADLILQLSDICVRSGRKVQWDPKKQTIVGDGELQKRMSRPMRKPWDALA